MGKGRVSSKEIGVGRDIDRYRRRLWEMSDNPQVRELQRQISQQTAMLSAQEMAARSDMILSLERAIDLAATPEARARLETALNKYRQDHTDQAVQLIDISGNLRTVAEAQQVLGKLANHTMAARDARLRANYMKALDTNHYSQLKNYISTLSDEEFKLAFYANPNATLGFEYHEDEYREAQLMEQWKRAVSDITERPVEPTPPPVVEPSPIKRVKVQNLNRKRIKVKNAVVSSDPNAAKSGGYTNNGK